MNDTPDSKAKSFLEFSVENLPDNPSSDDLIKLLTHLAELLDEEFDKCSLEAEELLRNPPEDTAVDDEEIPHDLEQEIDEIHRQRVALWAVQVGGIKAILGLKGQSSRTVDALYNSIINIARRVPNVNDFDVRRRGRIFPIEEQWDRAIIIAACELNREMEPTIYTRGARKLGIPQKTVINMVDNYRNGREPRPELTTLVDLAKKMAENPIHHLFDDLL
jgi:hypothetical protein